jgi:ubiquitin fusion degradation protein 1
MLFELTNTAVGKRTHCGVLEFTAEEGRCYLPFWMMQSLFMEEGTLLSVKNVTLPKASYVKFQAQSVDFLKINNPRAVLEVTLRKFTCLTKGDMVCLPYADKKYHLEVTDVQPGGAASIVESDVKVDFDEPVGYQQSEYGQAERANRERRAAEEAAKNAAAAAPRELQKAAAAAEAEEAAKKPAFVPFQGAARRIDGRKLGGPAEASSSSSSSSTPAAASTASPSGGRTLGGPAPAAASASASAPGPPVVGAYKPSIGNKYSKTKVASSAFTGAGHKLV